MKLRSLLWIVKVRILTRPCLEGTILEETLYCLSNLVKPKGYMFLYFLDQEPNLEKEARMISVRKNSGEVVILGTDQEKLLLSVIESAIHLQITPNPGSDDDRDLTKLRRLKSIVDADTPLERDHEPR